MHQLKGKKVGTAMARVLSIVLALAMMIPIFTIGGFSQETEGYGVVSSSSSLYARSGPGTKNDKVASLPSGWPVYIIGSALDSYQDLWYQVKFLDDGRTLSGYVKAQYITRINVVEDPEFEAYLTAQRFPESYKTQLRIMHTLYPKWVFEAVHTGLDWNDVLKKQAKAGINLVENTSLSCWINTSDVDENGNQVIRDAGKWVSASESIIKYYMDPRNFLFNPYIFQFLDQSYSSSSNYTLQGVEAILMNTFMESPNSFTAHGSTYTYAQTFMYAADLSGVSPYHLASRSKMENGSDGSVLTFGTVKGYEGYYNFYNIGAYSTKDHTAMENGAIYAQKTSPIDYLLPWDNAYDAIVGGAIFLGSGYIAKGQNTAYFQKFNVVNGLSKVATHQYMGCIYGPASEASVTKSAYSSTLLNSSLVFRIPIYTNMPESFCAKPTADDPYGIGDGSNDLSSSSQSSSSLPASESSESSKKDPVLSLIESIFNKGGSSSSSSSSRPSKPSKPSRPSSSQSSQSSSSSIPVVPESSVPEISTPEPSVPESSIPEISTPEVSTPEPSTPESSESESSVPESSVPEISTPEVSTPEVSTPESSKPESSGSSSNKTGLLSLILQALKKPSSKPQIEQVPDTSKPESSIPEVSLPEASAPESSTPEISTPEPSVPEISQPESSLPETSVPEVSTPETSLPDISEPEDDNDDESSGSPNGSYVSRLDLLQLILKSFK